MSQFVNNAAYSFSVYPPHISSKFQNVIVQGVVTYQLALQHADLVALHALYYPYLPEGTPDDPSIFDYVVVKLESGNTTVIATPWIKAETIVRADSFPLQITLPNVSPSDIPAIRDMLTVNGYKGYTIKNMVSKTVL